jgi:translation initiation factor 4B
VFESVLTLISLDSRTGYGGEKRTYSSTTGTYGSGGTGGEFAPALQALVSNSDRHHYLGYSVREELPLPDKPPFTVHLGNLSFDATSGDVQDFFDGCDCINVRIIEDKLEMKPKGFGYAEFSSRDGLVKALALSGSQFQGRNIRISVADPRKYIHTYIS